MACGNNKVSRDYLSSEPTSGPPAKRLFAQASDGLTDVTYKSTYAGKDFHGTHFYFGRDPSAPKGTRIDGHGHGFVDDRGNVVIYRDPYDWRGGKAARDAATKPYKPATRRRG